MNLKKGERSKEIYEPLARCRNAGVLVLYKQNPWLSIKVNTSLPLLLISLDPLSIL